MQLSKRTIDVLKNMAAINANILIKEGSKLSTIAVAKNIMAETEVTETFPNDVGIFNLPELLGVLALYDSPEIDFDKKHMVIKEGKSKMRYVYADPSILVYPQKDIKMPTPDVEFNISAAQLAQIQRAASAIGVQDIAFVGDGQTIGVQVIDKKNDSSNLYSVSLDTASDVEFTVYFKIENFKLISDDYSVSLSSKNISKFEGKNTKVVYYVAAEQDSSFK